MEMTKLTKLSIAFAIICVVSCCIAIAPLVVLATFALVALCCLFGCLGIYALGAILWLFSAAKVNIFSSAPVVFKFATTLFDYIGPVAEFSSSYITPYAVYAAIPAGVLGVIFSAVALARARREPTQDPANAQQALDTPSESSVSAAESPAETTVGSGQSGGIFDPYSVYNAEGKAVREKKEKDKKNKKPRVKKAKTPKGVCIAMMIVCIVFTVLAVAAVIFAYYGEAIFV